MQPDHRPSRLLLLMQRAVGLAVLIGVGIGLTRAVQWFESPTVEVESRTVSPDGTLELVIEQSDPGFFLQEPARTIFRVTGRVNGSVEYPVAGSSTYAIENQPSGGFDLSDRKPFWSGGKAVVDFGGRATLEWDGDGPFKEWHLHIAPPATAPTTNVR